MDQQETKKIQTLDREWLTVEEAAAYLRIHPMTVRRYIKSGLLPASQPVRRGRVLISAASIGKFLEKNQL